MNGLVTDQNIEVPKDSDPVLLPVVYTNLQSAESEHSGVIVRSNRFLVRAVGVRSILPCSIFTVELPHRGIFARGLVPESDLLVQFLQIFYRKQSKTSVQQRSD